MDRRLFLREAAGLATGAPALLAHNPPRTDAVRIACIGVKGRGMRLTRSFSSAKDSVVTTICDVDLNVCGPAVKSAEERQGTKPKVVQDLRRVMDDKEVDAVAIATPDHWHALAAVWACQAGKDVYLEKPVSHNISEGRRVVEAARKYKRIVQVGTGSRSTVWVQQAIDFLHRGGLGKIYMAKALCYKRRKSIGRQPDGPAPAGVDYDLWLGPAPKRPFNPNRFHYNWHWFWDYGTTDMGNQGVHQMEIARWGLGKNELPRKIHGTGGKYLYDDDQETPNTQLTTFEFDDQVLLVFEVRGLVTNDEKEIKIGNIFFGEKGYVTLGSSSWQTYLGEEAAPGPAGREAGDPDAHFHNFLDAVKARDPGVLRCDILQGHLSSALCHLGNISYRTGRKLTFDPKSETFPGDPEANAYLTRNYRPPFVLPSRV